MQFITQSGAPVGPVGQGTWYLGENPGTFDRECAALRAGVEAGMNLIDTAEMYGEGLAETMIGAAIQGLDRESCIWSPRSTPTTPAGTTSSAAARTPCAVCGPTTWTCTCSTGGAPSP